LDAPVLAARPVDDDEEDIGKRRRLAAGFERQIGNRSSRRHFAGRQARERVAVHQPNAVLSDADGLHVETLAIDDVGDAARGGDAHFMLGALAAKEEADSNSCGNGFFDVGRHGGGTIPTACTT
jgi:hypothetical protein